MSIDIDKLKEVALAAKGWSNITDVWRGMDGESYVIGHINEDGDVYPVAVVDTEQYYEQGPGLANFYAAANPAAVLELIAEVERLRAATRPAPIPAQTGRPIPTTLHCPECGAPHVDEGEWATRPHKTHQCQACRHEWRPYDYPTVGVGLTVVDEAWATFDRLRKVLKTPGYCDGTKYTEREAFGMALQCPASDRQVAPAKGSAS